jgi:hypothetical protein
MDAGWKQEGERRKEGLTTRRKEEGGPYNEEKGGRRALQRGERRKDGFETESLRFTNPMGTDVDNI